MGGKRFVSALIVIGAVAFFFRDAVFAQGGPERSPATDGQKTSQTTRKYTVWVFQLAGRDWVKQEDRTLKTDDENQARRYMESVKVVSGWTATSNLPAITRASDSVATPRGSIEGTTWKSSRTGYIRFAPGGVLLQSATGTGTFSANGNWSVCDCVVTLQIGGTPLYYPLGLVPSSFTGYWNGDRITGTWVAYNRPNNVWTSMYTRSDDR